MKTLKHTDTVRLASWVFATAEVGTLNGYCPEHAPVARQRKEPEAWTCYAGAILTDSKADHAARVALHAAAIVLLDGEIVMIEGREYRVDVISGNFGTSPRNSDPIHFLPL